MPPPASCAIIDENRTKGINKRKCHHITCKPVLMQQFMVIEDQRRYIDGKGEPYHMALSNPRSIGRRELNSKV